LTTPPPDPAKSSRQGVPSTSLVPPNPYGDPGSTSVTDRSAAPAAGTRLKGSAPPSETLAEKSPALR
jgi:hypothetical protein